MQTVSRWLKNNLINIIGLQTPEARILFFLLVTIVMLFISFEGLTNGPVLSIYSRLSIPSPSIGLTRAYWHFVHGNYQAAWQINHLIYLVVIIITIITALDVKTIIKKKK